MMRPFLAAMDADPEGQLMSLAEDQNISPIIIDEAQRSRKLALAIKKIVDNIVGRASSSVTGSSNVFTTAEVADSLAGRMRTLKPLAVVRGRDESRARKSVDRLGDARRAFAGADHGAGTAWPKRLILISSLPADFRRTRMLPVRCAAAPVSRLCRCGG